MSSRRVADGKERAERPNVRRIRCPRRHLPCRCYVRDFPAAGGTSARIIEGNGFTFQEVSRVGERTGWPGISKANLGRLRCLGRNHCRLDRSFCDLLAGSDPIGNGARVVAFARVSAATVVVGA
jgi:hypothetical protein